MQNINYFRSCPIAEIMAKNVEHIKHSGKHALLILKQCPYSNLTTLEVMTMTSTCGLYHMVLVIGTFSRPYALDSLSRFPNYRDYNIYMLLKIIYAGSNYNSSV